MTIGASAKHLFLPQTRTPMTLLRYAIIALFSCSGLLSSANWSPLNVGATGSASITTFNGAIYIATYNTGIRKSVDDGANWTLANTGLPQSGGICSVQSVGHNATTLFCGTESGVYRSTDNGASWVLANTGLPASNSNIYANKFYSFAGGMFAVFTGTVAQSSGIWRSVDNGVSWIAGFSGLQTNMTVFNMDEAGGVLYASTDTKLMRSSTQGQSWEQAGVTNWAVYAVQAVGTRLVAITTFGLQYSVNGGNSWTTSASYPVTGPTAGSELIAYDGKYFAITNQGSLGCYRSLDGGVTWAAFNTGLSAQNTFAQEEFHASGDKLYIACLFDSYVTPGSTVDVADAEVEVLPIPLPTVFTDRFSVDLSTIPTGQTLLLTDASGREVMRHANLPAAPVQIERNNLVAGRYHCMLLDPATGVLRSLGSVIAQ